MSFLTVSIVSKKHELVNSSVENNRIVFHNLHYYLFNLGYFAQEACRINSKACAIIMAFLSIG